jgi:tetratricopeptide (TPR) repeat protein
MVAETVLIEVNKDTVPDSLGSAHITADFTMHNLGANDESMAVRFPISADNGRSAYPEITDILIKVNGKQVTSRRADYPDLRYQLQNVPWAEFDVTFPAGQDVPIEVSYNLAGSGYAPYTAFYYILETGAGWKDTIGSADVILRLPYPVNTQNVVFDTQIGWAETTPGGKIDGNEVRWHFDEFEPGPYEVQNLEFAMVSPSAWQTVLKEQNNIAKSPKDGEAWGRLGMAYKQIFLLNKGYRTDAGGRELYQLSIEAYEKCLALLPNDAQWHAGFADLLARGSYWSSYMNISPEIIRALDEIHIALQLAPKDKVVQDIAENISYMYRDGIAPKGNGYDFPWLTQTPTPFPPTPTIVPAYDPSLLAGIYQSELLTLANNKTAQLTLTLKSDHSAVLESKGADNQNFTSTGTWDDLGDGSIQISVEDPYGKPIPLQFSPDGRNLKSVMYPSFYGDAGLNMKRLTPEGTSTPQPQQISSPTPPVVVPPAKTFQPFCGSAVLVVLILTFIWRIRHW